MTTVRWWNVCQHVEFHSSMDSPPTDFPTYCNSGFCHHHLERETFLFKRLFHLKVGSQSLKHGACWAKRDDTFSFTYDLISKTSWLWFLDSAHGHFSTAWCWITAGSACGNSLSWRRSWGCVYESWTEFKDGGVENLYSKKLRECGKLGCLLNERFMSNILNWHLFCDVHFFDHKMRASLLHWSERRKSWRSLTFLTRVLMVWPSIVCTLLAMETLARVFITLLVCHGGSLWMTMLRWNNYNGDMSPEVHCNWCNHCYILGMPDPRPDIRCVQYLS